MIAAAAAAAARRLFLLLQHRDAQIQDDVYLNFTHLNVAAAAPAAALSTPPSSVKLCLILEKKIQREKHKQFLANPFALRPSAVQCVCLDPPSFVKHPEMKTTEVMISAT